MAERSAAAARFPRTAFALLALLLVLQAAIFFDFEVDDAFIVLRYADNLSHGFGLVFNPGQRVEGFTCPALVLFEAAMILIGANALLAAKLVGLAAGVAAIAGTIKLAQDATQSRAVAVCAGAIMAVQPALAISSVNGLETSSFAACVVWACAMSLPPTVEKQINRAGLLLALAAWLRPEGILALVLLALALVQRHRDEPKRLRPAFLLARPALFVVAPMYVGKALYFRAPLPNTALAKVPAQLGLRLLSGLQYLIQLSSFHWDVAAWVCLGVLAALGIGRARLLAGIAFPWLIVIALTGGDWIPAGRFLLPILPIAATALAMAVQQLILATVAGAPARRTWISYVAVVVLLAPAARADAIGSWQATSALTRSTLESAIPLGRWLRHAAPYGGSVALLDVGAVGYQSGLNVIDTGGLTDTAIAQVMHGGDGTYRAHLFMPSAPVANTIARDVLMRLPDFVVVTLPEKMPSTDVASDRKPAIEGAYPQDTALFNELRKSTLYRFTCSVPGTGEVDGTKWDYSVFARVDLTLSPGLIEDKEHLHCRVYPADTSH